MRIHLRHYIPIFRIHLMCIVSVKTVKYYQFRSLLKVYVLKQFHFHGI
jgi:hypothetical protein